MVLFQDFLVANRLQIKDKLSSPGYLRRVPQGSILGPLFFNFYVADFRSCVANGKLIQFADDTQITYEFSSIGLILEKVLNLKVLERYLRNV